MLGIGALAASVGISPLEILSATKMILVILLVTYWASLLVIK